MNCAKIREFLITDYMDGEMNEKMKSIIMNHLSACEGCRQFELELKEKALGPFKSMERHTPPAYVWERIKDRIRNEVPPSPRPAFAWRLKPAFALSAVAVLILAVVIVTRAPFTGNGDVSVYLAEQAEYMIDPSANGAEISGFGTSIEEYLLS